MLDLSQDGIFTVENTATDDWRTFRIETQPMDAAFAPGKRVLALLVGPSNSRNYKSFGFIIQNQSTIQNEPGHYVSVWKSKRAEAEEPSDYEKFAKMLNYLAVTPSEKLQILDAIPCHRCGELLTVPKSIRAGMGPYCINQ